jgi:hypothetical protein
VEASDAPSEMRHHLLFAEDIDCWNQALFWVRPEYVLSWIRSGALPPLVSTGLTTDKSPGALGLPYTDVLYGGGPLDYKDRHGFRITAGATLRGDSDFAVEASYLTLGGRVQRFQSASPGSPVIARPFLDVVKNAQDSSLTTYPGFLSGSIDIANSSYLQSTEFNVFESLWKTDTRRLRALIGLRHVGIHEALDIQESSTVTAATNPLAGQSVHVRDAFHTTNNFYGAQVGVSADFRWRRFTTEFFTKAALGDLQQRVTIEGLTAFQGTTYQGGLLTQQTNIGSYVRDQFSVLPEGGVKLQGAVGRHVLLHVGYSFLYLGNVVRPGPHVDLGVNPNLVPTSNTFGAGADPARPAFRFQESNYWAHLFNFGLTVQY